MINGLRAAVEMSEDEVDVCTEGSYAHSNFELVVPDCFDLIMMSNMELLRGCLSLRHSAVIFPSVHVIGDSNAVSEC